jgi:peroxiredoxin Q/BCP
VKRCARFLALMCASAALTLMVNSMVDGGDKLKVGDKAPPFEGIDDQGKPWKSSDFVGKKIVVVYFYPADFTGGCTKQACGFRDDFKALTDKGVEVVGVSGDSVKNHAAFKKEYMLTFPLLADEDGKLAKTFGVPFKAGAAEVTFMGNKFVRGGTVTQRTTVVIGLDGNIAADYAVKDAGGDSKQILDMVKKLEKK